MALPLNPACALAAAGDSTPSDVPPPSCRKLPAAAPQTVPPCGASLLAPAGCYTSGQNAMIPPPPACRDFQRVPTEPDELLGRQNTSSPCIPSRSARIPAGQISSAPPPCRPLAVSLASKPRVREHGTVALRTVRHPVRKARTCGRYFAQTPAGSHGAAAHGLACPCFHWYEESAQCRLTPVQSPLPFRARNAAERCREHPFP